MSVTSSPPGDKPLSDAATETFTPLIGQTNPDRCSSCGAELAADQRYCVECGTRRGRARFSLPSAPGSAPAPSPAAAAPNAGIRMLTGEAGLLLTVILLLVAVGVGVMIGHTGNSPASGKPYIVKLDGVAGGTDSADTGSTGSTGSTASGNSGTSSNLATSGGKQVKVSKKAASANAAALKKAHINTHLTTAQKKAVAGAVTKVLGSSSKHLAAPTTKIGGTCKAGTAGCVNGKFTGNPFG